MKLLFLKNSIGMYEWCRSELIGKGGSFRAYTLKSRIEGGWKFLKNLINGKVGITGVGGKLY